MVQPSDSDRLLIDRIRGGEAEAWNELIARYEGRLLGYVVRRAPNRAAAEDVIAEKLGVKPGEPLAMIERVRTDNEVPVAVTIDYLPLSLLKSRGLSLQNLEAALKEQGSLYLCLRAVGLTIDGAIADIRSVVADRDVASALQLKPNTPVLMLCQTDYAADVPVIYSKQYQPSDVTVQVWRKGPG